MSSQQSLIIIHIISIMHSKLLATKQGLPIQSFNW